MRRKNLRSHEPLVMAVFQKITPQSLQAILQWACEPRGRATGHCRYEVSSQSVLH